MRRLAMAYKHEGSKMRGLKRGWDGCLSATAASANPSDYNPDPHSFGGAQGRRCSSWA
jgi:hypothetical protein